MILLLDTFDYHTLFEASSRRSAKHAPKFQNQSKEPGYIDANRLNALISASGKEFYPHTVLG